MRATASGENAKRRFTASIGVDVPVKSITKADVRRFKDALLTSVNERRGGKVLSPATVRKLLNALGAVLSYAVRQGYIESSPASNGVAMVVTKGSPQDRRLPLTVDDVKSILDATKDKQGPDYWIPRLAVYTGARADELCGLRVRDVQKIEGEWCVVVQPSEVRNLKTASSHRRIPFASRTAPIRLPRLRRGAACSGSGTAVP